MLGAEGQSDTSRPDPITGKPGTESALRLLGKKMVFQTPDSMAARTSVYEVARGYNNAQEMMRKKTQHSRILRDALLFRK